jgi:hypothetical protein
MNLENAIDAQFTRIADTFIKSGGTRERWIAVYDASLRIPSEGHKKSAENGQTADADAGNPLASQGHAEIAKEGQLSDAEASKLIPICKLQPASRGPSKSQLESDARIAKALVYGEYADMAYIDLKRRSKMDKAILNWLGYVPPERQGESIPQLIAADKFKDIKVRVERANEE